MKNYKFQLWLTCAMALTCIFPLSKSTQGMHQDSDEEPESSRDVNLEDLISRLSPETRDAMLADLLRQPSGGSKPGPRPQGQAPSRIEREGGYRTINSLEGKEREFWLKISSAKNFKLWSSDKPQKITINQDEGVEEEVWWQGNPITDDVLYFVMQCPNVRLLSIKRTSKGITDKGLSCISEMQNLEVVELYNCPQIAENGLWYLPKGVVSLTLDDFDVTDVDFQRAADLKLTYLRLSSCPRITGEGLQHFPKLAHLSLSECPQVTDDNLQYLSAMPGLQALKLSRCPNVTGNSLQYVTKGLRYLTLARCSITDEGLNYLSDMTQLESLHLTNCPGITGAGLDLSKLKSLTHLMLWDSTQISDAALQHLPISLTSISLRGCTNITNAALQHLPSKLKAIDLSGCIHITDAGLEHLPISLTSVNLKGCKKITARGVKKLKKRIPTLRKSGPLSVDDHLGKGKGEGDCIMQ